MAGELYRLQAGAGNRAVARHVATQRAGPVVQRCGCAGCGCVASDERDEASTSGATPGTSPGAAPVQRAVDPDFEVKGKSPRAAGSPGSVFFDRNSSAFDAVEDAKLSAFAGVALSTIKLKGFASEEETGRSALVDARIAAVKARLKAVSPGTGDPVPDPDLPAGAGQLDYRNVRRVEVLVAGAPSSVPNCSAGADIACGPSPNAFDKGHDAAKTTLLPAAITALATPNAAPAKAALALFGGVAQAKKVKKALTKTLNHLPNMLPAIPLNDTTAAGHRCINTCEGDVLAYNQGSGASARVTLGPQYLGMGNVTRQGLVIVHEATHGATGLTTKDKTYDWQRLVRFLPPAAALRNADSFTRFVELINDPAAPAKGQTDDASALPAAKRRAALESVGWLEQWLVQGRLEVRSLYSAVSKANQAVPRAWQPTGLWYRDNAMPRVATHFGLTAPPTVPSLDDQATIAGIFDRLAELRFALTGSGRTLKTGPAPSVWSPGPGPDITLSPGFLALGKKGKVERLLVMIVEAAPFIESGRRSAYVGLVKDMSPRFGGP